MIRKLQFCFTVAVGVHIFSSRSLCLGPVAGKDRTGVITALLLSLTGCAIERIGENYALTRIGTEKEREMLAQGLIALLGQNAMEHPAILTLGTCSIDVMKAFVEHVDQKYGGTASYIHNVLGLGASDAEKIKVNIGKK